MAENTELPEAYKQAEEEAIRFLARIAQLRWRLKNDEQFAKYINITGGPETASVKRASMDLTRQLAKMRRGES